MMTEIQSIIQERTDDVNRVRVLIYADDEVENPSFIIDNVDGECRLTDQVWMGFSISAGMLLEDLQEMAATHFADASCNAFSYVEGCHIWAVITDLANRLAKLILDDEDDEQEE